MKSGIYKITCKPTDKIYVGSSKNMKIRYRTHLSNLKSGRHGNPYMKNSYEKYGKEAFEFSILEYCEYENLLDREYFWINELNSTFSSIGFNIIYDFSREKKNTKNATQMSIKKNKVRFQRKDGKILNMQKEI